jgi:geranylgeranyl diphosphate synthase type II
LRKRAKVNDTGGNAGYREMMEADRKAVESSMERILPGSGELPVSLHKAMRHASLSRGKRLRGILCRHAHRMFGDPHPGDALSAASSIEFLHAYTLIHDDLPALDDDDTRRGVPACHVEFGEALAILAGDALQALAFETLSGCAGAKAEDVVRSVNIMAELAGSRHLVGGQVADLEGEGVRPAPGMVEFIHERKTAALIAAPLRIGAAMASAGAGDVEMLGKAGMDAGVAFQIMDDLLDETGSEKAVGKGLRKDVEKGKITWPATYGIEPSRSTAESLIKGAIAKAGSLGDDGYLKFLFHLVIERTS